MGALGVHAVRAGADMPGRDPPRPGGGRARDPQGEVEAQVRRLQGTRHMQHSQALILALASESGLDLQAKVLDVTAFPLRTAADRSNGQGVRYELPRKSGEESDFFGTN